MIEEPNPEEVIDITGPEGATLFCHAKKWLVSDRVEGIQAQLDEMWKHYGDEKDDRLLALVGALCVEHSLDALLQAFAPGFEQCTDDAGFTVAVKTKVARSLQLLPARILTACDLVRKIRNEFAHHLEYTDFSHVDADLLQKLEPTVRSFNHAKRGVAEYPLLFRHLIGFLIVGLCVYTEQARQTREFIEGPAGREGFKAWAEARQGVRVKP